MELTKRLYHGEKLRTLLSSDIFQKFYDAYVIYKKIENKNFLITSFYVFRLSIFYLIKKISQKIF